MSDFGMASEHSRYPSGPTTVGASHPEAGVSEASLVLSAIRMTICFPEATSASGVDEVRAHNNCLRLMVDAGCCAYLRRCRTISPERVMPRISKSITASFR